MPSEARDKGGTAQLQFTQLMKFVKPRSEQQALTVLDHSGCFLCEKGGDLLWVEHVICNPYTSETERKPGWRERDTQNRSEESWRNHTTSPPAASSVFIHSLRKQVTTNPLLFCQDQAGEEEEVDKGCNSMLTIQEEKRFTRSYDAKQHPDSRPGCRVSTVCRKWLFLWQKRIYTSKTFTKPSLTSYKESSKKLLTGFCRWLPVRRLLLQAGSGHPHLVASDHQHISQCDGEFLQPCFMSSPSMLRNRCFLDDGELVVLPHKDRVVGRPFLETRLNLLETPAAGTSQRKRGQGSCNMFKIFHRHTALELRVHFGEDSDSDLEELLVGDEVDGGGDDADTD